MRTGLSPRTFLPGPCFIVGAAAAAAAECLVAVLLSFLVYEGLLPFLYSNKQRALLLLQP